MIDCFGEQYNYEIIRYKDEKSNNVEDVYGGNEDINEDEDFRRYYPDDLEKLLYFIRSIYKSSMNKVGSTTAQSSTFAAPKTSSFSSLASKSPLIKKAGAQN